jgi:Na+/glutamate symporter
MCLMNLTKIGGAGSVGAALVMAGLVMAQTTTPPPSTDTVTETNIAISLPVYISSLVAAIVFTITLMKLDAKRANNVDRIERRIDRLAELMAQHHDMKGGEQ